jgi:hypothetical protein
LTNLTGQSSGISVELKVDSFPFQQGSGPRLEIVGKRVTDSCEHPCGVETRHRR